MVIEQEAIAAKAGVELLRRAGKLEGTDIQTRLPAWLLLTSNGLLMRVRLAARIAIAP